MPFDGVQARWQLDILAADKTAQAFTSVDRRIKNLEVGVAGMARTMSTVVGQTMALARGLQGAAAAYGVTTLAQRAFNAGLRVGDLGEQAEQLGLTTDQLQAYRLMAAQAGVSNEQLDATVLRLNRSMGAAAEGNDEMIARFKKLGVNVLDAEGKLRGPADVLPELSRGLINVASDTERSATMAEILGKSGARVTTMLNGWAGGNEKLIASARAQGAIVGPEAIQAWDDLGDKLKVAEQRFETMVGEMGKPVALIGLNMINQQLSLISGTIGAIQKGWSWLTGATGADLGGMKKELGEVEARIAKIGEPQSTGDRALLNREIARRDALARLITEAENGVITLPEVTVTPSSVGNPTGKAAAKAGETEAARQLRETQKAMDDLFDSIEKVRQDSEGVMDRFGDGAAYAARETAQLNEMLQMGFLDLGTHARAIEDVTRNADEMGRAFRGAGGGADAFIAGFEQGLADLERANSLFNLGRQSIDFLTDGLDLLAGTSNRTFGQMAVDFAMMIAKWELAAQASNIWNMVRGKGPTDQGLFGSILSGIGDIFSGSSSSGGVYNGGGSPTYGGPRAAGGPVDPGSWYMVGERGPEPFIPHAPGTIIPNRALGGGAPAIVNIYNQGGGEVRKEQRTGGDGQSITDIFITAIENKLARNLDNGTGAQSKVLQGRYGIAPVGRR